MSSNQLTEDLDSLCDDQSKFPLIVGNRVYECGMRALERRVDKRIVIDACDAWWCMYSAKQPEVQFIKHAYEHIGLGVQNLLQQAAATCSLGS